MKRLRDEKVVPPEQMFAIRLLRAARPLASSGTLRRSVRVSLARESSTRTRGVFRPVFASTALIGIFGLAAMLVGRPRDGALSTRVADVTPLSAPGAELIERYRVAYPTSMLADESWTLVFTVRALFAPTRGSAGLESSATCERSAVFGPLPLGSYSSLHGQRQWWTFRRNPSGVTCLNRPFTIGSRT